MLPTGRTENVTIKVKVEIKKILAEKRKKEGFNLSEWFEEKFNLEFIPSIEKLEEERKSYLDLAQACEKRIVTLNEGEMAEKKLILTEKLIRQLVIACDPKSSIKRQWGLFCASTKKKLTLKEFVKLKQKYLDKLYV